MVSLRTILFIITILLVAVVVDLNVLTGIMELLRSPSDMGVALGVLLIPVLTAFNMYAGNRINKMIKLDTK